MARGSTRSTEVNELTKQIIGEIVSEEYQAVGITSNPDSLFEDEGTSFGDSGDASLGRKRKLLPTIGSWYERLLVKAAENDNVDYQYHYSYLTKVMKQYCRKYDGQMAYFDGQSTFDLLDGSLFINIDISQLEEKFARPLAQQILMSWICEKSTNKHKIRK